MSTAESSASVGSAHHDEMKALEELAAAVRESDLVEPGSSGVVLVSGGADSACAAAGLVETCGASNVIALPLNYALRESADTDEAAASRLCERLGIGGAEVVRPRARRGQRPGRCP